MRVSFVPAAAVASAVGMSMKSTHIGGCNYNKQLSGIYDVIDDSDVNESATYTGLNHETREDKQTEQAPSHTNIGEPTNNYAQLPVGVRGAAANADYLQLSDDEYLTVQDYD